MVGTGPATADDLQPAARQVLEIVDDKDYLIACVKNGSERLRTTGARDRVTHYLLESLDEIPNKSINFDEAML
ncbi:hypothetical protein V0288_24500 [Pannus brasiliensis CCIBt3594]|uniref:Uncharacterized protein n=1 Tax=Pannus brasiliensis CCIBt3594 TaxID=1427578 RepID=A0AAW9R089_9CHRO